MSAMFAVSRDVSSAIQSMLEFWQESSCRMTHAINPSACMSTMELSCRFNERNKLVKTQVWDASTDAFTKKILRRDSSTGKWSKSPSCKITVSIQARPCSGVKSTAELDPAADSRQVFKCLKVGRVCNMTTDAASKSATLSPLA